MGVFDGFQIRPSDDDSVIAYFDPETGEAATGINCVHLIEPIHGIIYVPNTDDYSTVYFRPSKKASEI